MSELEFISEEFIEIATQEINDELSCISNILDSCENDGDIVKNSNKIEKHMHKIKGLAPMMGKEVVGNLAIPLDLILKKIIVGEKIDGIYEHLCISIEQMRTAMNNHQDIIKIQKMISKLSAVAN